MRLLFFLLPALWASLREKDAADLRSSSLAPPWSAPPLCSLARTVIVSKETDQIVGTGTLLIERKFIRSLSYPLRLRCLTLDPCADQSSSLSLSQRPPDAGLVGHIEDIAVSPSVQGRKLGLRIITALVGIGEQLGCYKTILDCNQDNVRESLPIPSHPITQSVCSTSCTR